MWPNTERCGQIRWPCVGDREQCQDSGSLVYTQIDQESFSFFAEGKNDFLSSFTKATFDQTLAQRVRQKIKWCSFMYIPVINM